MTTDVPGCRSFVRHGVDGYVLPVGDASALADAIGELASDRELVRAMGLAAAARVRDGFTVADIQSAVGELYRSMAGADRREAVP